MAGKGFMTGAAIGAMVAYMFTTKKGKKMCHDLHKHVDFHKAAKAFKKKVKAVKKKRAHSAKKRHAA